MPKGAKIFLLPRTRINNQDRVLAEKVKGIFNSFRDDVIAKLEPMTYGEVKESVLELFEGGPGSGRHKEFGGSVNDAYDAIKKGRIKFDYNKYYKYVNFVKRMRSKVSISNSELFKLETERIALHKDIVSSIIRLNKLPEENINYPSRDFNTFKLAIARMLDEEISNKEALRPIAVDPLGQRYQNQIYQTILAHKILGAETAGKFVSRQLKKPLRPRFFNTRITDVLKDRTLLITTKNILPNMENTFKNIITQGMREGATATQTIDRLKMLTGNYKTIARTEMNSAANEAGYLTAVDSLQQIGGLTKFLKGWQTANDEDVRDSHQVAGEEYGDGNEIPVTDLFELAGDSVQFPCEYGKEPKEVINCRCNAYFVPVF